MESNADFKELTPYDVAQVAYGCSAVTNTGIAGVSAPSNAETYSIGNFADELSADPIAREAIRHIRSDADCHKFIREFNDRKSGEFAIKNGLPLRIRRSDASIMG